VPSPRWALSHIHKAPERLAERSCPRTRSLTHVGMPGTGMHALWRQRELQPAGEVDGDQGGDVGDAVREATDIGALGQAPLEVLEEARDP